MQQEASASTAEQNWKKYCAANTRFPNRLVFRTLDGQTEIAQRYSARCVEMDCAGVSVPRTLLLGGLRFWENGNSQDSSQREWIELLFDNNR